MIQKDAEFTRSMELTRQISTLMTLAVVLKGNVIMTLVFFLNKKIVNCMGLEKLVNNVFTFSLVDRRENTINKNHTRSDGHKYK